MMVNIQWSHQRLDRDLSVNIQTVVSSILSPLIITGSKPFSKIWYNITHIYIYTVHHLVIYLTKKKCYNHRELATDPLAVFMLQDYDDASFSRLTKANGHTVNKWVNAHKTQSEMIQNATAQLVMLTQGNVLLLTTPHFVVLIHK